MSWKERFAMGGAGAMAPVLASLVALDFFVAFSTAVEQPFWALGVIVRAAFLFAVGGFWVHMFHTQETDRWKLFQLGVVAPAMLTSFLNASNSNPSDVASSGLIGTAHAQQFRQLDAAEQALDNMLRAKLKAMEADPNAPIFLTLEEIERLKRMGPIPVPNAARPPSKQFFDAFTGKR